MYHVRKKATNIICIYQQDENEDSIKCSEEIFPENHVSICFKREIEKWLQLALEFNPRQRGYRNYHPDNANNNLAIFTELKTLLEKKIITVFVVHTCEMRSYEIDDFTQISTVQGWIELDTKISKNEQVLLSLKCDDINLQGLATQFFDEFYSGPMLYIYKKTEILLLNIKPKFIPTLVEKMLHDTSPELQYFLQKRSYAQALYFIFIETNFYNTILDAYKLKLKKIIQICDQTSNVCRNMNTNIAKLIAQRDFSKEMLDFDFKQYLKNYSQNADHWNETFNAIVEKIDKIHGVCNQVTIRHESIYRRASTISVNLNREYSKHNDHDLNILLDKALNCYSNLRNRSKEERKTPESCKNMVLILYKMLKSRDKILRDSIYRKYLQVIIDTDNELTKMQIPLNSATELIEKYRQELISDHMFRQSKIWDFTIKQKQPKVKITSCDNSPKANFVIGNQKRPIIDYGAPISLEKPLEFILGDQRQSSSLESNTSTYHSLSPLPPNAENNLIELAKTPETVALKRNKNSFEMNGVSTRNDEAKPLNLNNNSLEVNKNHVINNPNSKTSITLHLPNFAIGQPASDMIDYNLNLRHELEEKTHQSFMQYKSILSEPLDFSFLKE